MGWNIPEIYKHVYKRGLTGEHITAGDMNYVEKLRNTLCELTEETYKEYFHNLLWFEEIEERKMLQDQHLKRVELRRTAYSNIYIIAVPGLTQKHTIRIHDRVLLISSLDLSKNVAEICQIDTKRKELMIKVKKAVPHRSTYETFKLIFLYSNYQNQQMHSAVCLVMGVHKSKIFPQINEMSVKTRPVLKWFNLQIGKNAEQRAAVEHIVAGTSRVSPYIIHGPPGTGKTVTVVEAILQVLKMNPSNTVMVCAPSNTAADDVASKLIKYKSTFHTDTFLIRLNSQNRDWSTLPQCLMPYTMNPKNVPINTWRIIVCTLGYAPEVAKSIYNVKHLFIDEAAQSTEPQCLVPISELLALNGLLVLSGDPMQLGPVLMSQHAKNYGLGLSLMERLMKDCSMYKNNDPNYMTKLKENYRSHADILSIPNEQFYEGELKACAKKQVISETNILNSKQNSRAIVFHAVFGEGQKQSSSYFNKMELSMVKLYVKRLIVKHNENLKDIGIITPYTAQVNKIKTWLESIDKQEIEVGSVENFQGKEKKIIIISTVRGNGKKSSKKVKIGFLADYKRFNVALTRAKDKLIVIGNPNCLNTDGLWRIFIAKCEEIGTYHDTKCIKHYKQQKMAQDMSKIINGVRKL